MLANRWAKKHPPHGFRRADFVASTARNRRNLYSRPPKKDLIDHPSPRRRFPPTFAYNVSGYAFTDVRTGHCTTTGNMTTNMKGSDGLYKSYGTWVTRGYCYRDGGGCSSRRTLNWRPLWQWTGCNRRVVTVGRIIQHHRFCRG
jgi:hypothetical protein